MKTSWRTLIVRTSEGVELTGSARLGILMRFLRDEGTYGHVFFDPVSRSALVHHTAVNWGRFPIQEATTAAWEVGRSSGIHPIPPRQERPKK